MFDLRMSFAFFVLVSAPVFPNTIRSEEGVRIKTLRNYHKTFNYQPELSYKMLLLSSVTYSKHQLQKCMNKAVPQDKFQVESVVTRPCDAIKSKCSGYVAFSHVLQAIVIAFRGTRDAFQLMDELLETLFVPSEDFLGGKVQSYWKRSFVVLWKDIEPRLKSLISAYPSYQVWVTGHSLGAAIASVASAWIAYKRMVPRENIILYTFGMPRVGDYKYALQHDQLVHNSWRVVNFDDIVPHVPLFTPGVPGGAYHHGQELFYTKPALSIYSPHKECHGKPTDEDLTCSRGLAITDLQQSVKHHLEYFGVRPGAYCATY